MAEGRSLCVLTAGAPSPARPRSPGTGPPQPATKPLIYEFDFDFVMRRGNFSQPALVYSEDRAVPQLYQQGKAGCSVWPGGSGQPVVLPG